MIFGENEARGIKYDFGEEFSFEEYNRTDSLPAQKIKGEAVIEFRVKSKETSVSVISSESGGKILKLTKDIPTFDSFDRVSDSWHSLFLYRNESHIDGIYCTGGYKLSRVIECGRLLSAPDGLTEMLELMERGVFPEHFSGHAAGETFLLPAKAGGIAFTVNSDGKSVTVSRGSKAAGKLILPDEIDGLTVTDIENGAFADCVELTSVRFPDGTAVIGDCAFKGCKGLSEIKFPFGSRLTEIKSSAFYGCSELRRIWFPRTLGRIGKEAFKDCGLTGISFNGCCCIVEDGAFGCCKMLEEVSDCANVKFIDGVFSGCDRKSEFAHAVENNEFTLYDGVFYSKDRKTLCKYPAEREDKVFKVPDGTVYIRENAFYRCDNIERTVLPPSIGEISAGSFLNCINLVSVTVHEENGFLCDDNGILFDKNKSRLVFYPTGRTDEEYYVPEGVSAICSAAFKSCSRIRRIVLPRSLREIGCRAFCGCSSLESIVIPDGVDSILEDTFMHCANLKEISLPEGLRFIGAGAFGNCGAEVISFGGTREDWEKISIDRNAFRYTQKEKITVKFTKNSKTLC